MANRNLTIPVEGESRELGGLPPGVQGTLYAASNGGAGKGTVWALDGISAAGVTTTWYFFVTSAGVLKVASTYPTNTESDGAAV